MHSFLNHPASKGIIFILLFIFYAQILFVTCRFLFFEQTKVPIWSVFMVTGVASLFSESGTSLFSSSLANLFFFIVQGLLLSNILPQKMRNKTLIIIVCLFVTYTWAVAQMYNGKTEHVWLALSLAAGILAVFFLTRKTVKKGSDQKNIN